MSTRYPTAAELKRIRKWPNYDWPSLLYFISKIWWMPEWGWTFKRRQYWISTGGWSGNEEIVCAMKDNKLFWDMCWVSSRRGGHYKFMTPKKKS